MRVSGIALSVCAKSLNLWKSMSSFGKRTLLTIYESNDAFGVEETTEGLGSFEMVRLCGYLDLTKYRIIQRINDETEATDLND